MCDLIIVEIGCRKYFLTYSLQLLEAKYYVDIWHIHKGPSNALFQNVKITLTSAPIQQISLGKFSLGSKITRKLKLHSSTPI
jgi:hypothetical protein